MQYESIGKNKQTVFLEFSICSHWILRLEEFQHLDLSWGLFAVTAVTDPLIAWFHWRVVYKFYRLSRSDHRKNRKHFSLSFLEKRANWERDLANNILYLDRSAKTQNWPTVRDYDSDTVLERIVAPLVFQF